MRLTKKLLVIHGPNLDKLGTRKPEVYGKTTYKELIKIIKEKAKELGFKAVAMQSYDEGKIAKKIAHTSYEYLLMNPGAYSHYSIAIRDAIESNEKLKVAICHISDIEKREQFRHTDLMKDVAKVYVMGEGIEGYKRAIEELSKI